jgi:glycosyltransferase involved in cell wall biosynthesis
MYKHLKVLILLVFVYSFFATAEQYKLTQVTKKDPLLVVALMIKNEAPVIADTLKPLVDGGIDSFLIFDTGSRDNTIEKVIEFFTTHSIANFAIAQENFVDFSTSRNRGLDLVDEYFPEATFILMPDAEWIIRGVPELLQFCQSNKYDFHSSYLILLVHNITTEFYVDRLMRRECRCRFKCPVHEYLVSPSVGSVPNSIFIECNSSDYGSQKTRKRWERDLGILLKAYAENPSEPRTVFYLAQTYSCLGDKENAMRFYELRTQLPSWVEENYEAVYRLAGVIEEIAAQDAEKKTPYDWNLAQWYYLKAFSMHHNRIEPLVRIAQHYLQALDYVNAFLFAERASELPYPTQDILFVEKEMYMYTRYDIMAQSGIRIGEYSKGEWAVKKALEYKPEENHLLDLLKEYMTH